MAQPTSNYQGQGDKIADPRQIAALLKRLQSARLLLTVIVQGAEGQFNSMILDVDPHQGVLLLDELTPREGHNKLMRSRRLRVYAQLRGVNINFVAEVADVTNSADGAAYRLPLPESLFYLQRRAYYRVEVPRSAHIAFTFTREYGDEYRGYIADLSLGGVAGRVIIAKEQAPILQIGEILSPCALIFTPKEQVPCKFEVRFPQYNEEAGELRIGLRFAEIERTDLKRVERYIMSLQRERLKSMPRA